MGVTGLLPNLKEIQESTTLEKFRGKTLAIDTYGWLHRGLISCAQELCQGQPTRKYITSIMKKVDMLRYFGVEPYFVFDGASLPTKAETAKERKVRRDEAQRKASEYTRDGNTKLAWKEYMKAACVTHEMAKSIMVELKLKNIKYIVAPYEADPQMVYLEKIGEVDGILSEDSDLLIFGCNRLITKLKDDSTCVEICRQRFDKVRMIPNLANYTDEQLRLVAMLSGCDYTKGIPGVGLKSAFNLVKKFNNLEKILPALRADGKTVPEKFIDEVYKADLAFQFQKVFDPKNRILKTLNAYPKEMVLDLETLESCCGLTLNDELYSRICSGEVHPNSHEPLVSREQNLTILKSSSVNYGTARLQPAQRTKSNPEVGGSRRGVLDMLKTSRVTKTNIFDSVKTTKVAEQAVPQTPSRVIKRTYTETKSGLSPTSRKLQKISHGASSPVCKQSKFFSPNEKVPQSKIPTPVSEKEWDSSFISGDSDIPDEFSSPMVQRTVHITITEEDNLTDEDQEKEKIDKIEDDIEDSMPKDSVVETNNFDVDENDDIEESPMKPAVNKLTKFALRSQFLFQENRTSLPMPVQKKLPTPINSDEIHEEDEEISEEESQPRKALKPVNLNVPVKLKPANLNKPGDLNVPAKTNVSLKNRFAFRGL